jgi:hypothetical protein
LLTQKKIFFFFFFFFFPYKKCSHNAPVAKRNETSFNETTNNVFVHNNNNDGLHPIRTIRSHISPKPLVEKKIVQTSPQRLVRARLCAEQWQQEVRSDFK